MARQSVYSKKPIEGAAIGYQQDRRLRSAVAPLLVAQSVEAGGSAGWFIIGGALAILGIGIVIVIMARIGSRESELNDRITVRSEAVALSEPPPAPPPEPKPPPEATFIDLPGSPPGDVVDLREKPPAAKEGRRSPLSAYHDDAEQAETFVDLPAAQQQDPVVDLTDESVDLTEEREEAAPKRDPWD